MRLLLIEDHRSPVSATARTLRTHAYAVDVESDAASALAACRITPYDAVVVHRDLSSPNGRAVCQALRQSGSLVRILMLSRHASTDAIVAGLASGADDYLVVPYARAELLARLRTLLRRRAAETPVARFVLDDCVIDFPARRVTRRGVTIELTAKEFTVLACLAEHAGTPVDRATLTQHAWDENHDPASNAVEVYINRLRKKLHVGGSRPLIQNRRGAGYFLGVVAPGKSPTE